jgi:hypothetical protein
MLALSIKKAQRIKIYLLLKNHNSVCFKSLYGFSGGLPAKDFLLKTNSVL